MIKEATLKDIQGNLNQYICELYFTEPSSAKRNYGRTFTVTYFFLINVFIFPLNSCVDL